MAEIVIQDIPEVIKEQLQAQADSHGHSLEAEVWSILARSLEVPNVAFTLHEATPHIDSAGDGKDILLRLHERTRTDDGTGVDFIAPERTDMPRAANFS